MRQRIYPMGADQCVGFRRVGVTGIGQMKRAMLNSGVQDSGFQDPSSECISNSLRAMAVPVCTPHIFPE